MFAPISFFFLGGGGGVGLFNVDVIQQKTKMYSLNQIYLLVLQNRALRSQILSPITMIIRLAADDFACS
jgi:hypothetical protein